MQEEESVQSMALPFTQNINLETIQKKGDDVEINSKDQDESRENDDFDQEIAENLSYGENEEFDAITDEREIRILLVDDQAFNLILLESLIMTNFPNAQCETALNGKLAFDKVVQNDRAGTKFDLILMDINMPEMDGIESSRLITKEFKEGRISAKPFISAITAYTSEQMNRKALENGMEKFLTKPA